MRGDGGSGRLLGKKYREDEEVPPRYILKYSTGGAIFSSFVTQKRKRTPLRGNDLRVRERKQHSKKVGRMRMAKALRALRGP